METVMTSLLKRLGNVARSYVNAGSRRREELKDIDEDPLRNGDWRAKDNGTYHGRKQEEASTRFSQDRPSYSGLPQQVVDDLAVFNLTPPASMDAIRQARNREIKKYHSDKFINDPEKLETSKEIMQIYNAAYDRLKSYYESC